MPCKELCKTLKLVLKRCGQKSCKALELVVKPSGKELCKALELVLKRCGQKSCKASELQGLCKISDRNKLRTRLQS